MRPFYILNLLIIALISGLCLTGASCLRFQEPSTYPGDFRKNSLKGVNRPAYLQRPPAPPDPAQQKKWKLELKRLKKQNQSSTQIQLQTAYCFRHLGMFESAAESFARAAKREKKHALKKRYEMLAVQAYADAGLHAEAAGRLKEAVRLYELCNQYCRQVNRGVHIPHALIDHLKHDAENGKH
jgi:tetratricopeptide (TPR) repeat protein